MDIDARRGILKMSEASSYRTYLKSDSAAFHKTNEVWGGLSNMAPGFPVEVNGVRIRTSEALYQACRFPHLPEVQQMIIDQKSPMTAKMKSKPFRRNSRTDWEAVKVAIMRWCLRIKLAQNWESFGDLLVTSGTNPIVEESTRDDYWGARLVDENTLHGRNILGRLLMELRADLISRSAGLRTVEPVPIPDFLLLTNPITVIGAPVVGQRISAPDAAQSAVRGPRQLAMEIPGLVPGSRTRPKEEA